MIEVVTVGKEIIRTEHTLMGVMCKNQIIVSVNSDSWIQHKKMRDTSEVLIGTPIRMHIRNMPVINSADIIKIIFNWVAN